eukprot:5968750-Pyramimonas_sp.AAC.1
MRSEQSAHTALLPFVTCSVSCALLMWSCRGGPRLHVARRAPFCGVGHAFRGDPLLLACPADHDHSFLRPIILHL